MIHDRPLTPLDRIIHALAALTACTVAWASILAVFL